MDTDVPGTAEPKEPPGAAVARCPNAPKDGAGAAVDEAGLLPNPDADAPKAGAASVTASI